MMCFITSHTHTQVLTQLCGCHDSFVCRHTVGRVHRRPCGNAQQNPQLDRTEILIEIKTQICKIARSRWSSAGVGLLVSAMSLFKSAYQNSHLSLLDVKNAQFCIRGTHQPEGGFWSQKPTSKKLLVRNPKHDNSPGLYCLNTGLFSVNIGLFCANTSLFCVKRHFVCFKLGLIFKERLCTSGFSKQDRRGK